MTSPSDMVPVESVDVRTRCPKCGLPKRRTCDGQGWLDAIGPCADDSYITSRPCPNDR